MLGSQYNKPRGVRAEISASPRFRHGIAALARELGRSEDEVSNEADRYLAEMVSGLGRRMLSWRLSIGRHLYQQGYDEVIDYDEEQTRRVRDAMQRHASVVLASHRSYLDGVVMPAARHEAGLPPAHIIAGINIAFWPVGSIGRRSGMIFIRRNTKDSPVYRFVLREYVGYLIEKRLHVEWFIEGTRSRTGKLLPPRMGLLTYVVDAYRDGRADDVVLIPASITYDHLGETSEFAREAQGYTKKAEGLGWLLRYWRGLRGRHGRIHLRFGEPLSLRRMIGAPGDNGTGDQSAALQKVAFEVSRRINEVTPASATSLVTLTLLAAGDYAMTLQQIRTALATYLTFAVDHDMPMTVSARRLDTQEGVEAALNELVRLQVVERYEGFDKVYVIDRGQRLEAAFYRNSIIHFFLDHAIAEVALVRAAEPDVADPVAAFWDQAIALRDLLKFDFFFLPTDEFRASMSRELSRHDADWERRVADGPASIRSLLHDLRPMVASTTIRPFLEGYYVVARVVERQPPGEIDESAVLKSCEGFGRQLLLQGRIHNAEAASRLVLKGGLQLAENRGLLEPGPDLGPRRAALLTELRDALQHVHVVAEINRAEFRQLLAGAP